MATINDALLEIQAAQRLSQLIDSNAHPRFVSLGQTVVLRAGNQDTVVLSAVGSTIVDLDAAATALNNSLNTVRGVLANKLKAEAKARVQSASTILDGIV